jgi:hypothetical protein
MQRCAVARRGHGNHGGPLQALLGRGVRLEQGVFDGSCRLEASSRGQPHFCEVFGDAHAVEIPADDRLYPAVDVTRQYGCRWVETGNQHQAGWGAVEA